MKNGQPADVAVINTCTVTHRADADSLNIIRKAIRQNPKANIVVTGCLTAFDIDKIRRIREVDIIVKIKDQNKITQLLPRKFNLGIRNVMRKSNTGGITDFQGHTRVFLKIQDGCNNFCSYCKIPLVRGASYSRELAEIIQEARGLVRNGFKEIVLCGICLGIYGQDLVHRIDIVAHIEQLEAIPGILRIRLSSIEARDV